MYMSLNKKRKQYIVSILFIIHFITMDRVWELSGDPRSKSLSQLKAYLAPLREGIRRRNLAARNQSVRLALRHIHRLYAFQKRQRAAIVLTQSLRDYTQSRRDYHLSVVYKERMKIRKDQELSQYRVTVDPSKQLEYGCTVM